jgi:ABC-type transport system involved in multi-copper enzyme maturation permease subunit
MTAVTYSRPVRVQPGRTSLATLTRVELRKSYDTRAGAWLLAVIGAVAVAMVVLQVAVLDAGDDSFAGLFLSVQLPVGVLLPVVGILMVTSEWSTRSVVPTFSLVPDRRRVVAAKLAAAVLLALAAVATGAAAAAAGHLAAVAAGAPDSWALAPGDTALVALFQLVNVLVGVAFGLALLSSPLAIVLFFVLPTGFTVVTLLVDSLRDPARWLDLSAATEPLLGSAVTDAPMDGQAWAHLGTALLLWLALPLVLGVVRVLRDDVT